jgi:polar amino acid transport system permease protein
MFFAAGMMYLIIAAVMIGCFRLLERRINRYQYYKLDQSQR